MIIFPLNSGTFIKCERISSQRLRTENMAIVLGQNHERNTNLMPFLCLEPIDVAVAHLRVLVWFWTSVNCGSAEIFGVWACEMCFEHCFVGFSMQKAL